MSRINATKHLSRILYREMPYLDTVSAGKNHCFHFLCNTCSECAFNNGVKDFPISELDRSIAWGEMK